MRAQGTGKPRLILRIASLAVVVAGFGVALAIILTRPPSTDDATIDADVVHVAAAVGGRVTELPVHENDLVPKGALLFQIDPVPYRLALDQARRAETNLGLTARTADRLKPLTDKGYVPQQELDQAQVAHRDAASSLSQAQEQERAARRAIDTVAAAEAGVEAAQAAMANARRALDDTTVRAMHAGRVVGLTASTGEMVLPSQSLFTLVNTEEWFAVANLRETELAAVAIGDCATVYSMIDRRRPMKGTVTGVGWGVQDDDRINLPHSVPYVKPSVNWVRVAHRFPVRIRLEGPPPALVRLGASAEVQVRHGAACRS